MAGTSRRGFLAGALFLPALVRTATAQVTGIRLGKQHGLPFLPQMVMEAQRLIEKRSSGSRRCRLAGRPCRAPAP